MPTPQEITWQTMMERADACDAAALKIAAEISELPELGDTPKQHAIVVRGLEMVRYETRRQGQLTRRDNYRIAGEHARRLDAVAQGMKTLASLLPGGR